MLSLLLVGCANPARNLYEGIKGNHDAKRTPMERAVSPTPSYNEYKKQLEPR